MVGALLLAGVVVSGMGPAAEATTPACRVRNTAQGTWLSSQSGRALTTAIDQSAPGERLNIFGRCKGNFSINHDLALSGPTNRQEPAVLDGAGVTGSSVLSVFNAAVTLTRLTITGGNTSDRSGGGIQNGGDLTLNQSNVVGNRSGNNGGGIFSFGDLTLNHTRVSRNTAVGAGGGLYLADGGVAVLNFSRVTGNSATGGGGIFSEGTPPTLNRTVVSGNVPDDCSC